MIRNIFGGTIAGFGCLVWGIWGIVGLLVNLGVVHDAIGWGFFGVILAFIFFPFTLTIAPFYALVAWGEWLPLIVTYGGGLMGVTIVAIGVIIRSGAIIRCPSCNYENEKGSWMCLRCGKSIEDFLEPLSNRVINPPFWANALSILVGAIFGWYFIVLLAMIFGGSHFLTILAVVAIFPGAFLGNRLLHGALR